MNELREQESRLREIETRKAEIALELETREAELAGEQIEALSNEVAALNEERAKITELQEKRAALRQAVADGTKGATVHAFSAGTGEEQRAAPKDRHDTPEYRAAFMEYVCRGAAMPMELRAGEVTSLADVGAVIPTSTLQEIIRRLDSYGAIYAKIRKLSIQGGVRVPILTLRPEAKWVGEGYSADQKIAADEYISFGYYGLECKIAQTLLASIVTYEMFQREFVKLSVEAIVKEIEKCIFKGTGEGQLLGLCVDPRVPSENKFHLSAADFTSWGGWKKQVFTKMKKAYRNGIFVMAQGTFDGYIDGMTDETGQPIARVNFGITQGETYRFGGKAVETVEDDVIVGYDEAAVGEVVAVFFNPTDYAVNSNMQMTVVKWQDHDTNQVKNKAILVIDGKLIDPHGVLVIQKGA